MKRVLLYAVAFSPAFAHKTAPCPNGQSGEVVFALATLVAVLRLDVGGPESSRHPVLNHIDIFTRAQKSP